MTLQGPGDTVEGPRYNSSFCSHSAGTASGTQPGPARNRTSGTPRPFRRPQKTPDATMPPGDARSLGRTSWGHTGVLAETFVLTLELGYCLDRLGARMLDIGLTMVSRLVARAEQGHGRLGDLPLPPMYP